MALPKKWRFFASLKLAVIVIVGLAIISAVGTIVEARYNDAEIAQKLVYQSIWMKFILGLLCVNLIGVMVDRWPWRQHHAAFVMAHIGIILLLFGAWLTERYGVDGTMAFRVGESAQDVVVRDRDLLVYASLDGNTMQQIYEAPVDFLTNPPSEEKPYTVHLGMDELRFLEYHHFAFRDNEIKPGDSDKNGPGVRVQLENANVNVTQWLLKAPLRTFQELNLGPARVVLADTFMAPSGQNEIILVHRPGRDFLDYIIYGKDKKVQKKGTIKQAQTIETGWMGLKFRLLRYLPRAEEVVRFIPNQRATPATTSALRFTLRGKEHWVGIDTTIPLFLDDRAYLISYRRRALRLSFPLTLNKFTMGLNPGTASAASYESDVQVPGVGEIKISMNEPLKHEGFTFYQSSFEQDDSGRPVLSVLSVNHDPGRWIKYLGSLMIVLGSIMLFYFKRGFFKARSVQ